MNRFTVVVGYVLLAPLFFAVANAEPPKRPAKYEVPFPPRSRRLLAPSTAATDWAKLRLPRGGREHGCAAARRVG